MITATMYTRNVCPNCDLAKAQLAHLPVKVDWAYKNVDKDPSAMEDLTGRLESMSTPTFEIERDGKKYVVRGFEQGELQEAFGL